MTRSRPFLMPLVGEVRSRQRTPASEEQPEHRPEQLTHRTAEAPVGREQCVAVREPAAARYDRDRTAQRVTDDDDGSVLLAERAQAVGYGGAPFGVLLAWQRDDLRTEPRQQRRIDGPACIRQGSGQRSHVGGGAGEAVHEQHRAARLADGGHTERLMLLLSEEREAAQVWRWFVGHGGI